MLTENEKQILGYMVDMGGLRGQQRIDASADDELARELIEDFSIQIRATLPMQIEALTAQRNNLEEQINQAQTLLELVG